MNPTIEELTRAAEQEAKKRLEVLRLMTHPGVGPLTALAFVLIIGTPERFKCGKQIGSYVGLSPSEDSSAGHQRLGHITKQGSSLLRFLLGEAAQAAARCDADWRRRNMQNSHQRHRPAPFTGRLAGFTRHRQCRARCPRLRTVVWQGSAGNRCPYADLTG
jgi:transposase